MGPLAIARSRPRLGRVFFPAALLLAVTLITLLTALPPARAALTLPTWGTIAAGGFHSLAIESRGTLWATGANLAGQLGDRSQAGRPSGTHTKTG